MTFTDEEIFNIKYNIKFDKLEVEKKSWTSKVLKLIKKYKIISICVLIFFILSTINSIFIYNFIIAIEKM